MRIHLILIATIGMFGASVLLGAKAPAGKGDMISKLKPMYLTTSLAENSKPAATIVASDRYKVAAEKLQGAIERKIGANLPIVSDEAALKDTKSLGNIIALGHYGTNKLVERLYDRWYIVVDGVQPGAGGYALQTVHNLDGMGINVIVVGGSDDAGVAKAADRLTAVVEEHGVELPRLFEVELGAGKDKVLARGEEVLDPNRTWPRIHPMEVLQSIAEAGILYQYTADERYAQAFKKHLTNWLDGTLLASTSDDIYRIFVTWDLLEESPVFNDEERLRITNQLLSEMRKEWSPYPPELGRPNYNLDNFNQMKEESKPRSNHTIRFAVGFFFGGRYFKQYYDLTETNEWLAEVRKYFRPQMKSYDVMEGSVDSIALISLIDAVTYALADDQREFLSADVLGRIADKHLMKTLPGQPLSPSRTPFLFWCLAAHRLDRPEYLQPIYAADPTMGAIRVPWRNGWQLGRSFWDGTVPLPTDQPAEWAQVMPIGPMYYANCYAHGPKNVSQSSAFEFLTFKPPGGNQLLIVGGHNTGSYSDNIANAITELWWNGRQWIVGGGRVSTAQKQASVTVVRNGESEAMPAFARLDHVESHGEGWGGSRSSVPGYNGTDWHRNVLAVTDKWFLVIDEIAAREPGNYLLENRWRSYSHAGFDGDDALFVQHATADGAQALRLIGAGWQRQYMLPWLYSDYLTAPMYPLPADLASLDPSRTNTVVAILARRWAGNMHPGQTQRFATLLLAHPFGEASPYALTEKPDNFVITGESEAWKIERQADGAWAVKTIDPSADANPTADVTNAPNRSSSASTLSPAWSARESSRILSSAAVGSRLAVGTADGKIHLYDESGQVATTIDMPGKVWALLGIDLNDDGAEELVTAGEGAGVRAFGSDGTELWQFELPAWQPNPSWRQSMGERQNVVTDLYAMRNGKDGVRILASGLYFYVLDPNGKLVSKYDDRAELQFTDLVAVKAQGLGRTLQNVLVLAAGDLDGDGADELIGDVNDPGFNKVRVWSAKNGKRLAGFDRPRDRFLGSGIKAIASGDVNGDGKDEFVVGADAYLDQLSLYNLEKGLLWGRSVGGAADCVQLADINRDGREEIVVATELGQVQAIDRAGKTLWLADVGSAATSLLVAGDRVWTGTVDGRVVELDMKGNRRSEAHIGGLVDHLSATSGTDVIWACSADGQIAAFKL